MIEHVRAAIHGNYQVQWKRNGYPLERGHKVFAPQATAQVLKLDDAKVPEPFRFFSPNPPQGLKRMCDAIVLYWKGDTLYCALIELKTGNPKGSLEQLANGKMFCDWLIALLRYHEYIPTARVTYYGVLMWHPPGIPEKGTTTPEPLAGEKHKLFRKFFDIRDRLEISVDDLIDAPVKRRRQATET